MCCNNIFLWDEDTEYLGTHLFFWNMVQGICLHRCSKMSLLSKEKRAEPCEDPEHRSQGYNSSEELQKCYITVEDQAWNFLLCCCVFSWLGNWCNLASLEGNAPSVSIFLDSLKWISYRSLYVLQNTTANPSGPGFFVCLFVQKANYYCFNPFPHGSV